LVLQFDADPELAQFSSLRVQSERTKTDHHARWLSFAQAEMRRTCEVSDDSSATSIPRICAQFRN
jgi:hypothetical protein